MSQIYRFYTFCKTLLNSLRCAFMLAAALLLVPPCVPPAAALHAPDTINVLILHSYHQGYEWTDSVHSGFVDELTASGRDDLLLFVEYLDTTRNPGEEHARMMRDLLRYRYTEKGIAFGVVICTDDNALRFLLEEGEALFGEVPAVFCGINDFTPEHIAGRRNITGVNESISVRETLEVALALRPSAKRIAVISDSTLTGRRNQTLFENIEPAFADEVEFLHLKELEPEELALRLGKLSSDDAVLYLSYLLTPSGRVFPVQESVRFVTASAEAPVFGCWDFLLPHGVIGGKVAHGYSQGQEAASLALQILGGASADDLPVLLESPNRYVFNASVLEMFDIPESSLPRRSLLVNRRIPPLPDEWKGLADSTFFGYDLFMTYGVPMLLVDPETGVVLDGNHAAHSFYGYRELRGMPLEQIDAKMSPEELRTQIRRTAALHSNHFSTRNRLADGSEREVEVYTYPVSIGDKSIFFSMIVDETDRVLAEQEIRRRNIVIAAGVAVALLLQSGALILLAKNASRRKKAERNLAKQLNLTRSLIDTMPNPVFYKDPAGRYLGCNDAYSELTGIPRESLSGKSVREMWPEEFADMFEKTDNEVFASLRPLRYEGTITDAGGGTRNIIFNKAPFFDEKNAFAGIVGVATDITEHVRSATLLAEKAHELERHQEAIITSMAVLAEFRDGGTGEHIERTRSYVRLLLERSEARKHYPAEHFGLIARSAVLHDIGKVGIPDRILLKPGPLTPEEFDTVRTHPIIGSYAIGKAEKTLGEAKFLKYAREIIQFHHEKWDGSGYPYGFKGEEIPYAGRLMAIADVYDALVSERPYKKAFSHEKALEIIASESGRHFDPALVQLFLECAEEFKAISEGKVYDDLDRAFTGGFA